jgi:hypothetical protein
MDPLDGRWPVERSPSEVLAEVRRRAYARRARHVGIASVVVLLLVAPLALIAANRNPSEVQSVAGPDGKSRDDGDRVVGASTSTTTSNGEGEAPPPSAPGTSYAATARAPEIGITDKEIHLGNVSTLAKPLGDLSGESSVAGARAVVAYQNSIGGMWGRRLVLDVFDDLGLAPRNRDQTAAALKQSFAMLGSFSYQDGASADLVAGSATPDATQATSAARHAVANNFSVAPFDIDRAATTSFKAFHERSEAATAAVATFWLDDETHERVSRAHTAAAAAAGWKIVYSRAIVHSEADFTADIVRMRQQGVRTVYVAALRRQDTIRLARAMRQQGYTPDFFIAAGEAKVLPSDPYADGVMVPSDVDPGGAGASDEAALFRSWMERVAPGTTPDEIAALAWAEGRLLFQAMDAAGPSASRRDVLGALRSIHAFSANDLIARADPADKQPTTCVVVTRNQSGGRVRVMPSQGFRCDGELMRAR